MSTIRDSIIESVGNGARTTSAIAIDANLSENQVTDNLSHLKREGIVVTTHAGMELAPGQRMPVRNIDPASIELTPAVEASLGRAVPAQPKSNGNGADHHKATPAVVIVEKRKRGRPAAPPQASAAKRVKRGKVQRRAKAPRSTAAHSASPAIEIGRFGEFVVIKRDDLARLSQLFAAILQWRDAIKAV